MNILVEERHQMMNTKTQLWELIHKACSKIPKDIDLAQELRNKNPIIYET